MDVFIVIHLKLYSTNHLMRFLNYLSVYTYNIKMNFK